MLQPESMTRNPLKIWWQEDWGISIVSEKAVKDYVESRRLLQFSLPEEFSGREFYIVYQKNYILKECAGEFIKFLKAYQK